MVIKAVILTAMALGLLGATSAPGSPMEPPQVPLKQFIYGPMVYVVAMRVTACSPEDPQDKAYYAKHGYEGAPYGIAAHRAWYPKGTEIRVPGYRKGAWESVDSGGGSVIRRSARRGTEHIDVKFRTLYSVRQWGSRALDVEVILPPGAPRGLHDRLSRIAKNKYPQWVKEVQ